MSDSPPTWWEAFYTLVLGPHLLGIAITALVLSAFLTAWCKQNPGNPRKPLVLGLNAIVALTAVMTFIMASFNQAPAPPPIGSPKLKQMDEVLFSPVIDGLNKVNR